MLLRDARPTTLGIQGALRTGWSYRWVVVTIAFLTVGVGLGTRAAFGVLLVPLSESLGWGRGLTAGAISLNALVSALCAMPLGAVLDRWGGRRAFACAAALSGLGLIIAASTREPWQLYLGVGMLMGVGYALLRPQSMGVVVSNWFVTQRGLAMGIVSSGIGLGVLVLAPLTEWVLGHAGWEGAFLALGMVFLLGIAPLNLLFQRHRPEDCGLQPLERRAPGARTRGPGPTLREGLRNARFWLVAVGMGLGAVSLNLLLVHGIPYLIDAGFSPARATSVLALSGVGAAGAMLLWGWVADRWNGEWAYTAGSLALMAAIGVLYVVRPGGDALLYGYAALFALGFASRQGLASFMVAELVAGRSLGALMGVVGAQISLGTAIGPALGGWTYDYSGSYEVAFVVSLVTAVVSVGCIWLAAPRHGVIPCAARQDERGAIAR
jgi:predicted MFS family arabinose efflux permease